jgi:hypothetical protein
VDVQDTLVLILSWVRVTRSLVLCVCFVDRCLSFCTFSFGHCVVCSSSIYDIRILITPLVSSNSSYWYRAIFISEQLKVCKLRKKNNMYYKILSNVDNCQYDGVHSFLSLISSGNVCTNGIGVTT